jgi:hypothetical protein
MSIIRVKAIRLSLFRFCCKGKITNSNLPMCKIYTAIFLLQGVKTNRNFLYFCTSGVEPDFYICSSLRKSQKEKFKYLNFQV